MKKIFYSMMAVALCACSQSDVDDNMVAPQPENNGLKFEVVDNGFIGEDGTRVSYGAYGTSTAYTATFEEGDQIGVYAIRSTDMATDNTPAAYVVENAPLTFANGKWTGSIDIQDADLLFAYAPYRADANLGDGKPLFTGAQGSWAVSTDNNRFFVHPYLNQNNSTLEAFKAADWMGAAANVTSDTKTVTFNMIHMRGMVEVTIPSNVELTDLTLAIDGDNGAQYHFDPYLFATTSTKKVYRILTTEYRSTNTVYATIQDANIVKKYKKTLSGNGAGKCFCMNINYTPVEIITVGNGQTLEAILAGSNPTTLRLAGTLSEADWTFMQGLALTSLDMYQLQNTEIPQNWMKNAATLKESLTSLVLPNVLTTIGGDALQFGSKQISIELPASVTTLGNGAFYGSNGLSLRIPENSNLQTIGQGAFLNVKAVYTDPASINVLKIPASVTKIDGAAFGGVNQLTKVIFQSENAPEIVNGAYALTFNESVKVSVPNSANYKGKGLFPGMTVTVGPALSVENYYSPFTYEAPSGWPEDGIGLAGLCDGVTGVGGKHWHSDYAYYHNYGEWGIYIDITLPEADNDLMVSYTTRSENGNAAPKKVRMAVSNDGETYTAVGDDFTTSAAVVDGAKQGNETKVFGPVTAGAPYKYVRFAVLESENGSNICANVENSGVCINLAELTLYKETWTE